MVEWLFRIKREGPAGAATPRDSAHRKVGTLPVDTKNSTATVTHPSTREEPLHACLEGVVYVGHLVEEDGEEAEVVEAVPCRRCGPVAADVGISDPTKRNA